VSMMHAILSVIKELFPFRTCNLNLSKENILKGKFRVCLEYQIGNCMGPCENLQTEEEYMNNLEQVHNILEGKIAVVLNRIKENLNLAVQEMRFEDAQRIKQKLDLLSNYQSKSTVVNTSLSNLDVFSIASEQDLAFVNFLKIMNGAIIQTQTCELKKRLDESNEEHLT